MNQPADSKEGPSVKKQLAEALTEWQEMASPLYGWNWHDTTGGSFSVRLRSQGTLFALTPEHAGFRRWKLIERGLVGLNMNVERSTYTTASEDLSAHPGARVHQNSYRHFPLANAALHDHAAYSLAFACATASMQPFTPQSQMLGEIPCLDSDVDQVEERHKSLVHEQEQQITSGVAGSDCVARHCSGLPGQDISRLGDRAGELKRHGLAFTVYQHGVFVMARILSEAFDNPIRVERNDQIRLLVRDQPFTPQI